MHNAVRIRDAEKRLRLSGLQKLKAQLLGPRQKDREITGKGDEEVEGEAEDKKKERREVRKYRGREGE